MRRKFFALLAIIVFGCLSVAAQTKNNIIKYINENNLYRKGNDVTVTKLNLEWPLELNGDGMANLQKELCKSLLDVDASTMEDGWIEFHNNLGTRISHMPDSVTRHYYYADLQELWIEKGRYISFYLKKQVVDEQGKQQSAEKKFLTYDLLNDEIIPVDKVFTQYVDEYSRATFESLIDHYSICDDDDKPGIDLTKLPVDFALAGRAMFIGLGGPIDHDDFSTLSINDLYQLGLLKRGFIKYVEGKTKPKKDKSIITPKNFDTSLSTDSIHFRLSSLPHFPGGNDSLIVFLKNNTTYPESDLILKNEGRVVVSFVVEKDGSLSNLTIPAPLTPGLDREAIRVVRLMPKWVPGQVDGKNVRTYMQIPITFRLRAGM